MVEWALSTLAGMILGLLLYLCVRLRTKMLSACSSRTRLVLIQIWAATIVLMIVIGNVSLYALRSGLLLMQPEASTLPYEIGFAIVGFAVGLALVTRKAWLQQCSVFYCW